jgi:CheY-like chemotaxis protein
VARILIIDDEEDVRLILREALEYAGYEVVEAGDGQEGLLHYHAMAPDLIITDLRMPGKGGLETIRELRRKAPEVKIIAISGGDFTGGVDGLDQAKRLGAQRVFPKPLRVIEMFDAVREILQG